MNVITYIIWFGVFLRGVRSRVDSPIRGSPASPFPLAVVEDHPPGPLPRKVGRGPGVVLVEEVALNRLALLRLVEVLGDLLGRALRVR